MYTRQLHLSIIYQPTYLPILRMGSKLLVESGFVGKHHYITCLALEGIWLVTKGESNAISMSLSEPSEDEYLIWDTKSLMILTKLWL